jgi:mannosyltransferase
MMQTEKPQCLSFNHASVRQGWLVGRGLGLVLAAVVLTGLGIRSYHLSARSLWFDEAFCWKLTQLPASEVLSRVARDNHPPLYFLLLKVWVAVFGDSAFALRGLSVVCGGLTIGGMYLFAAEAFRGRGGEGKTAAGGREIGLVVAALVALNVFQIRWAWEARMYTMGTALVALSSWTLFRALHASEQTIRPWLVYAFLTLLFAYTHYYALFSIAAQAVFMTGYLLVAGVRRGGVAVLQNRMFWNAALAGLIVTAGWLPWLPYFLRQRDQVRAAFWGQSPTWVDIPKLCVQMFVDPQDADLSSPNLLACASLCGMGLLAIRWGAQAGRGRLFSAGTWYVLTAAVFPVITGVLASFLVTRVIDVRYFLFAHLFLLAGFGVLLGQAPSRAKRSFGYAVVLGTFLVTYINFWSKLDVAHKPGAREAAAWIAEHRRPGEPVVVCSPLLFLPMLHHASDRTDYYLWGDFQEVPHYNGAAVLNPADFLDPERLPAFSGRRLWAVNLEKTSGKSLAMSRVLPASLRHFVNRERASGKSLAVPVPAPWIARAQERFPEVYRFQGTVHVVEYEHAGR